jgi:hypothetical protein
MAAKVKKENGLSPFLNASIFPFVRPILLGDHPRATWSHQRFTKQLAGRSFLTSAQELAARIEWISLLSNGCFTALQSASSLPLC